MILYISAIFACQIDDQYIKLKLSFLAFLLVPFEAGWPHICLAALIGFVN